MTADTTADTTPGMTVYPIPRPDRRSDDRFTIGLVLDVAAVLHRHGYPPITTGVDLLRVQQALFTLIYQEKP